MTVRVDPLLRAWFALVLLSGAVTLLSLRPGRAAGAAILLIALAKARLILSRYLGLSDFPAWLTAFTLACLGLDTLLLGLYLAA